MSNSLKEISARAVEEDTRWTLEDEWLNTNHEGFEKTLYRIEMNIVKCERFLNAQSEVSEQDRILLHSAHTTIGIYKKLYQAERLDRSAQKIIESSPLRLVVEAALNRLYECFYGPKPLENVILGKYHPHSELAKDLGVSYEDLVEIMKVALNAWAVEYAKSTCWKTSENKAGVIYQLTPTGKRYVLHQRTLATK